VGRAQDHRLRARRHAAEHVVQIGVVAGQRTLAQLGPRQRDRRRVGFERGRRHHDLVAGVEGGERHQRDQLVGAVTDDELPGLDAEAHGQRLAQREATAVGIEVDPARLAANGLDHARRGTERVLVRRQPGQLGQAQLAHERFQRLAGVVRREPIQNGAPQLSQTRLLLSGGFTSAGTT
jgi:hypothetical protein